MGERFVKGTVPDPENEGQTINKVFHVLNVGSDKAAINSIKKFRPHATELKVVKGSADANSTEPPVVEE